MEFSRRLAETEWISSLLTLFHVKHAKGGDKKEIKFHVKHCKSQMILL